MTKPIYLDYAAATPVDPKVMAAMQPYFSASFYNPSAIYLNAKAIRADIEQARHSVSFWLGSKPSEIIFTAGGTEANNLAISGIMQEFPGNNLVISSIEHDSVREPAKKYDYKEALVSQDGVMDVASLGATIDDDTVLVSVIYANNEIGTVQPINQIATLLQKVRINRVKKGINTPLYLHTDACQAGNYLDLHAARLGVDLMTLNGGKLYGPKQSGCLYIKSGAQLAGQILGGGQERGLRSGTENVPGIIGFAKALEIAQKMRSIETKRLSELRDYLVQKITENLPDVVINGSLKKRLPNNISVTFPGVDNERLMMQLDEAGIMCAIGSACSASNDEPSHVLKAIGLTDDQAQSTLRFSLGRMTRESDVEKVIRVLREILND